MHDGYVILAMVVTWRLRICYFCISPVILPQL